MYRRWSPDGGWLGEVSGQEGQRRRLLGGEERVIVAARTELHHGSGRERPGQRLHPGAKRVGVAGRDPHRAVAERGGVRDRVGGSSAP